MKTIFQTCTKCKDETVHLVKNNEVKCSNCGKILKINK